MCTDQQSWATFKANNRGKKTFHAVAPDIPRLQVCGYKTRKMNIIIAVHSIQHNNILPKLKEYV